MFFTCKINIYLLQLIEKVSYTFVNIIIGGILYEGNINRQRKSRKS